MARAEQVTAGHVLRGAGQARRVEEGERGSARPLEKKERKKTDTPNEGWDKDRVPTCTSRILEERSGGQVGLSCS